MRGVSVQRALDARLKAPCVRRRRPSRTLAHLRAKMRRHSHHQCRTGQLRRLKARTQRQMEVTKPALPTAMSDATRMAGSAGRPAHITHLLHKQEPQCSSEQVDERADAEAQPTTMVCICEGGYARKGGCRVCVARALSLRGTVRVPSHSRGPGARRSGRSRNCDHLREATSIASTMAKYDLRIAAGGVAMA